MTNETQQKNIETPKNGLSQTVLERIEKERVTVLPRWHFLFSEYAIWALWGLSVVFGAISVSVMLYVSMHAGFAMYEATHETPLSFFIEVLPYLWIFVFFIMALFAYINMRKTKKGYKYPLWHIVMSSLLFSLVGGGILHSAGVGYLIDAHIARNIPMFPSLAVSEEHMWQSPDKGRIVGMFKGQTEVKNELLFNDLDGVDWVFNTEELMLKDVALLESGKRVRVIGIVSSTSKDYFYGCAVFPWMFDAPVVFNSSRKEREAFMERIEVHKRYIQERRKKIEEKIERAFGERDESYDIDEKEMRCPAMPVVKRLLQSK